MISTGPILYHLPRSDRIAREMPRGLGGSRPLTHRVPSGGEPRPTLLFPGGWCIYWEKQYARWASRFPGELTC
jgi:hypothetical protein